MKKALRYSLKALKYGLIALGLMLVALIAFLLITSEEDDGKRKAIKVSKIDWAILLDLENENAEGIAEIEVEGKEVFAYEHLYEYVKIFNENKDSISDTKKNGYSKIYVMFEKDNYISTDSFPTRYNGKDTIFYIKSNLVAELIKENEKKIKEYKERNPDIDFEKRI